MKGLFNNVKKIKKKHGFTLVELLGVITVLGVIITIVIVIGINVINNAKEKSYKVTINNIEKAANSYVNEYKNNMFWLSLNENNQVYQCVTIQNLIDTGYFKGDILDSKVADDRNVYASDNIYVGMDDSTKTINKTVLIYDDSSSLSNLCSVSDVDANIGIKIPDGILKEKEVTITYKISNRVGIASGYQYNYLQENDNSVKKDNTVFSKTKHIEKFVVKKNGILVANVLDKDGNVVVVKRQNITGIDNEGPVIVSNTEKVTSNVLTIPIKITDEGIGFDVSSFEINDLNISIDGNKISSGITLDKIDNNNYNLNIENNNYNGNLKVSIDNNKISDLLGNGNESTEIYSKKIYTIVYDVNGGIGNFDSQLKVHGVDLTLVSGKPSRDNYSFVGWSNNKDDSTALYQSGGRYNVDKGETLFAIWKIIDNVAPTCTLKVEGTKISATFSDNDGGSGIAYYGWDKNYSGSMTVSDTIDSEKIYKYYVKDIVGNTGSCSISVVATTKTGSCGSYKGTYPDCYETIANKIGNAQCGNVATGVCKCVKGSKSENLACTTSGCPCSRGYTYSSGNCKVTKTCTCKNVGGWLSDTGCYVNSNYSREGTVTYSCASGYTKINNSYCYK